MRFKKGSKVEVLPKKSPDAWYCAEIISGNGHTYSVRYEYPSTIDGNTIVERIPRKAIRPCPPPESLNDLVTGVLTEALISGAWKVAVILKVLSGDCYLVRLVGSLEEYRAHKSHIRPRQTWQDGIWFVTGKIDSKLPHIGTRSNLNEGIAFPFQEKTDFETLDFGSSRTLKRSCSSCSSHIGTYPIKVRRVEKESRSKQIISGSSFPFFDKVDAGDSLQENLGVKYLNISFNCETSNYCETEKGDTYGGISCVPKRSRKAIDYDSDICSVGSCSVVYSEAEYSHECREESSYVPSNGNERERIHGLELQAYRSTLVALHASGPLSWEREALLTNLRISLHISDDEYCLTAFDGSLYFPRPKLGACMPCIYWSEDDIDYECVLLFSYDCTFMLYMLLKTMA